MFFVLNTVFLFERCPVEWHHLLLSNACPTPHSTIAKFKFMSIFLFVECVSDPCICRILCINYLMPRVVAVWKHWIWWQWRSWTQRWTSFRSLPRQTPSPRQNCRSSSLRFTVCGVSHTFNASKFSNFVKQFLSPVGCTLLNIYDYKTLATLALKHARRSIEPL